MRGLVATGVPYPGLATIELDVGMRVEFVGQQVVDGSHSVWCCHRVNIIEVSQQQFIGSKPALDCLEGGPLSQCEQSWHEGVSLFAPFGLVDDVGLPGAIVPNVL